VTSPAGSYNTVSRRAGEDLGLHQDHKNDSENPILNNSLNICVPRKCSE
jgi:hypothetical protein